MRFDRQTGLVRYIEALRYRNADDDVPVLWIDEVLTWGYVGGYLLPTTASVTWFDERGPWAVFTVDEVVYNTDVEAYIRATGP